MVTINTLLSHKDQLLLENTLIKNGRVVTFDQIKDVAGKGYSVEELRNRVALLSKKGWLLRLKRGLYLVVTDFSILGLSDVSEYVIAQALNQNSYISLENALQYHSMFDQGLRSFSSVTKTRARTYETEDRTIYRFFHVQKELYFGFTEEVISKSYRVNMAEAEKALLDLLYCHSSSLTADIVLEKLKDYQHRLDFQKLKNYAKHYSLRIIREVGFLLDEIGVETNDLQKMANLKPGSYSKMSKDSNVFNAKWRLYYDAYLTQ
ncbi:MAG TPA: type IV toxin-antitoxin system AbiEi family antitoxin domain-containing protein [Candidatus Dormibacteraeota bacterium]|nr:type IV toxin-antitoxin system AbiEi family antitoxin domain-containing protein [Candidatus Dormibacteraeota bacterium]